MVIIINGPCGIGKTTTAWAVQEQFERSVMIDGDYICATHPFEIYDRNRVTYLHRMIHHVVAFHQQEGGYRDFVINYVFEKPKTLQALVERLTELEGEIYTFRLVADDQVIEQRVRGRNKGDDLDWYLNRFRELLAIQNAPDVREQLGTVIDTTDLSPAETATAIMKAVASE